MRAKPSVEIIIPAYNEEKCLEGSLVLLLDYLRKNLNLPWTITVADNASTDGTARIGQSLAAQKEEITYKRISRKGRGYALKEVFSRCGSDIVCYMDADLSTDLECFAPLVQKIINGCDIAVGSRLAVGAKTNRGRFREFLSRGYSFLVRALFSAGFSDPQCGFKALRADVAKKLAAQAENNNWFFDTEMLLLAERGGLKIAEVPVRWRDDPTSTVDVAKTVAEDIAGLLRMKSKFIIQSGIRQKNPLK